MTAEDEIECENCGETISQETQKCPNCGDDQTVETDDLYEHDKIEKAMEALDMIDDESYQVKGGDSSSLVERIKELAPDDLQKREKKTPLRSEVEREDIDDKEKDEGEVEELEEEMEELEEEMEEVVEYECPLCGTTVSEDDKECPGCGAVFQE